MQHIVPYTPHQNGATNRMYCTLKEIENCMIQYKGLSVHFLAKAINCDIYIVDHTPTKDLKDITMKETWIKIKPHVSLLCVFSSEAWAHIVDEK